MKNWHSFTTSLLALLLLICTSCDGQNQYHSLSVKDFQQKINELSNEIILDVRTPEEFAEGHLSQANNIDWTNNFSQAIANLPKDQPIMVYCLSGGRSVEAAEKLSAMGFAQVYEMNGGLMKWKSQNLPLEDQPNDVATAAENGMTKEAYDQLINSKEQVLIDFYADWCKPCKQMEPMLKELAIEQKNKLEVVRIDADDNESISQIMGVDALPALFLYYKGKLVWQKRGLTGKDEILSQMK